MKINLKRLLSLLLAVLMISTLIVGCGNGESAEPGKTETPGEEPSKEPAEPGTDVKDTLTVGINYDPFTLDPHDAGDSGTVNALTPIYDTLVVYNQDSEIEPSLATSWERIDDLTWKFHLREGVKFHNGNEFTADDVVYSFTRAASPAGIKVSYVTGQFDPENTYAEDDYTVIVGTTVPYPIIGMLTYAGCNIVNKDYFLEDEEQAIAHPVGTGPFEFVEWRQKDYTKYKRFDGYWGEKPQYENLVMRTIVESNSRVIELEAGSIDIAYQIPPNDIERLEQNPDTKIVRNDATQFNFLGFVGNREPFDNPDFRLAIDLAINQQVLIDAVWRGTARYIPTPLSPHSEYYDDSDTEVRYDPDKSREMLDELGIEEGTKFTLSIQEDQVTLDAATVIKDQLSQVGLDIQIDLLEAGVFYQTLESGTFEMYITGWGAVGIVEPDNNMYGTLHGNMVPASNALFFDNEEYNKAMDDSRRAAEGEEKAAALLKAQQLVRSETPMVMIANFEAIVGVRSNIEGFKPSMGDNHFVRHAYFTE